MYYTRVKEALSKVIDDSSLEQVLFSLSQIACEIEERCEISESENLDYTGEASKYAKLANDLHDLSNLVG